jgi:hypothetical protein
MINPLSRGDCTRFLPSDGNKASIPPPHRAGTVPGFLSGSHTFLATLTKKIRIRKSFPRRGLRVSFRGNCRFFRKTNVPVVPSMCRGADEVLAPKFVFRIGNYTDETGTA